MELTEGSFRFAELTSAMIELYVLVESGGGNLDEVPNDLLRAELQTYAEYFRLAREIAAIYAPGFSERIDAAIARLSGINAAELADPETPVGPSAS